MANSQLEKIEALRLRKKQIANRLASLEAKAKTSERKKDARQKIIVGAAVLAHAKGDTVFAQSLVKILDKAVTRDIDREAIAAFLPQK